MKDALNDFRTLKVYQLSYELAMEIFFLTKSFPKDEMYSLTDQIRRSSRAIPANIGEGYRKRIYPLTFAAKCLMLMVKRVKQLFTWIFRKIVVISLRKNIKT